MPVVYHCPHCRQPVTVPDEMLGQAITCPQCRGAFQTFPAQPPAPAAPAKDPLSLDDDDEPPADAGGDGFDTLGTSSRRSRAGTRSGTSSRRGTEKKGLPLPNLLAMIAVVIGSAVTLAYNQANRKPNQGFNPKEMLISAAVGGVCAAVGFGIGKLIEGNAASAPKRRGRRDDDDD